jgi:replicative DNA helicase
MQDSPSLEMQCKLLGAYMENPDVFEKVENLIRPNLFTTASTRKSYDIIKVYHTKGIKPDMSLVFKALIKSGISQSDAVIATKFSEHTYLPENKVVEYTESLFGDYVARYLSDAFKGAIGNFASSDPLAVMGKVKDAITTVELALNGVSKDKSIKVMFDETVQRMKDLKSGEIKQLGFTWGLKNLDEKTGGIVQGLNVLAGSKGEGKTTEIVMIIVHNAVLSQIPLLFFSLEMKAIEILTNVVANIKEINSRKLRMGDLNEDEILSVSEIRSRLDESFSIDETGGITWQYFETKVKAHRKKHKIPINQTMLVALDYLQLMKNSADEMRMSKEERIEQICNELTRICKNENIALVLLSQFSREVDKRGTDKFSQEKDEFKSFRPRMSDLKGSSAIESNGVTILLLYRPEYRGILVGPKGMDLKGICEINIAKCRYADPQPVYARFEGRYSRFTDCTIEELLGTSSEPTF